MDIRIVSTRGHEASDMEIISFWRLMFSPEQLRWNPDDSPELAEWENRRIIDFYRNNLSKRQTGFGFWATADGEVVGNAGVRIPSEASRTHCGELGIAVDTRYHRRGIGFALVTAAERQALSEGLYRIECSCFANNGAALALLDKAGFAREGCKSQSIRQGGVFIDQVMFGKLIRNAER